METENLEKMQKSAIVKIKNVLTDAINSSTATRIGEFRTLHLMAFMDVDKTTDSLKSILEYRKALAMESLKSHDIDTLIEIKDALLYSEEMILQVLGMSAIIKKEP